MINNNRSLDKSGFVKLIGFLFLGLLAACATGNPYEIAKVTIPTLKSDMVRIFVDRKQNPIALLKPKVRLYTQGIIRITRHPQAIGQIIWCITHQLWIGSSFMLFTCIGLIGHHVFAIWHGDRRLKAKFGESFEELKSQTSIIPFLAVLDGRQKLSFNEFIRPSQLGIVIAVSVLWWAHRFIPLGSQVLLSSPLGKMLS